ncbi:hypothetical protein ADUPG1_012320, partial [Aduncisulcus paluster]
MNMPTRFTQSELDRLKCDITCSYPFYELYGRICAFFDEFSKSSKTILARRDIFTLCFSYLSNQLIYEIPLRRSLNPIFHTVLPDLGSNPISHSVLPDLGSNPISHTVLSDLGSFFKSMFPSMIRVESVLREASTDKPEEGEKDGTSPYGASRVGKRRTRDKRENKKKPLEAEDKMSQITILLLRIIKSSMKLTLFRYDYPNLQKILFGEISGFLSIIFSLGETKNFSNFKVLDILELCQEYAFSEENTPFIRNSLLSILLPHILPWMRKYPTIDGYMKWLSILRYVSSDTNPDVASPSRSSQLWFMFLPVLNNLKEIGHRKKEFGKDVVNFVLSRSLAFFSNLCSNPTHMAEIFKETKGFLDFWFDIVKECKEKMKGKDEENDGMRYWCKLVSTFSTIP